MNFHNAYQKCVGQYIDAIVQCIVLIIIIETMYKHLKNSYEAYFR